MTEYESRGWRKNAYDSVAALGPAGLCTEPTRGLLKPLRAMSGFVYQTV